MRDGPTFSRVIPHRSGLAHCILEYEKHERVNDHPFAIDKANDRTRPPRSAATGV